MATPTNMDSGLYAPPTGIPQAAEQETAYEIEVVDPEAVSEEEAMLLASFSDEAQAEENTGFSDNLVEQLDESTIAILASELTHDIDNDRNSRADWEKMYIDGVKLLGLKREPRTSPWPGASDVNHPMITEAMVRFQSEMITETFPAAGPTKAKIIGKETPKKKEASERVITDMNYMLTERMPEFRGEHERLLFGLPGCGAGFKKVYYDPSKGRPVSEYVQAGDVLLPYGVSGARASHRVTHVMRKTENEIRRLQYTGFYRDVELTLPVKNIDEIRQAMDEEIGMNDLNDEFYTLYECCVDLDLKGFEDADEDGPTGVALPYVVTLIRDTNIVLSVRRNWKEDDALKQRRQHFVQYDYIPGFGPYGFGLFHLIGSFANSATGTMRQLMDAGTLSNLPGGLKSRGLRIKGEDQPIEPGEFRDVDIGGGTIKDNILPLPYKEPSQTLFNLLQMIIEEGRRFASTADMQVSDMSAQAPVGTVLALIERQLKVLTAVQGRTHNSLTQELKLIKQLVVENISDDPEYDYEPETGSPPARREDYALVDVVPVSDPNASTLAQRVVQYQAVIQLSQMAPQIYDLPQLHRGMLDVLGIKNADKLVALPDDLRPVDPVSENMAVLKAKPVKAFLHQDHESHIRVHMSAMQDPIIMKLLGQNPQAPMLMAAMQAHVAEHVGYAYRQKIEQQLGMPMPAEGEKLSPELEVALSGMMAQAAQQVLMQSQQKAAAEQAAQQAKDPVLQMQQKELEIKAKTVEIADTKMKLDAAAKADELALAREKMEKELELKGAQLGVDVEKSRTELAAKQIAEGTRIGAQIARDKARDRLDQKKLDKPTPPKPSKP
jgi:chaperonin GroES